MDFYRRNLLTPIIIDLQIIGISPYIIVERIEKVKVHERSWMIREELLVNLRNQTCSDPKITLQNEGKCMFGGGNSASMQIPPPWSHTRYLVVYLSHYQSTVSVLGKRSQLWGGREQNNLDPMGTSKSITTSNHCNLQKVSCCLSSDFQVMQIPLLANSNSGPYSSKILGKIFQLNQNDIFKALR